MKCDDYSVYTTATHEKLRQDLEKTTGVYNKASNMYLSGNFTVGANKFYIKEVLYNNPATIVFWSDNTKTITKCQGEDIYSNETGLAICILKKLVGSTNVRNILHDWMPEEGSNRVTLKNVRYKIKRGVDANTPVITSAKAVEEPVQTTFEDLSFRDFVESKKTKKLNM